MGLTDEERRDLIAYRLQRATETLTEAMDVYKLKHYILAANRLYYAAYYAVSALLIKDGHSAITHSGIRSVVGRSYVMTGTLTRQEGKLFSDLFNMRQTGDYGDSYNINEDDIEEYLEPTVNFVQRITEIVTR